MGDVSTWSTSAGSNNSAAPDGAPEGQAPSSVNNVIRENMRAVRAWYNDSQWVAFGDGDGSATIAYASATSFTVAGVDVTTTYHAGRGIRAVGSSTGTIYGIITSSSFSTNTTVNVAWITGSLSNESLTISIAALSNGAGSSLRGGWQLIDVQTASTSATLDFTKGINSTFDMYMFVLTNILPATDGAGLQLRVSEDAGSNWQSDATDYEYHFELRKSSSATPSSVNSQGATSILITAATIGSAAGEALNGTVYAHGPASTTNHMFRYDVVYMSNDATAELFQSTGVGVRNDATTAITGVRFLMSSGNITSGSIAMYGLRK